MKAFYVITSRCLMMLVASQMPLPFNADFRPETGKPQLQLGQKNAWDAPVLSHSSLLGNP
jgi:hypothetical protein